VKSVSGDQCEIANKRSDDTRVTPEVNTDYQYFNLPLWYSGMCETYWLQTKLLDWLYIASEQIDYVELLG